MRNRSAKGKGDAKGHSDEHYTMLAEEFGHARRGYRAIDEGRALSGGRLLLQPLSLFIMSLLALVFLCGVQLWRMGIFDPLFAAKGAVVDKSSKRWLLNGHAPRAAYDGPAVIAEPEQVIPDKPADDENAQ